MVKLRWLVLHNKDGSMDKPALQFREYHFEEWKDVPYEEEYDEKPALKS